MLDDSVESDCRVETMREHEHAVADQGHRRVEHRAGDVKQRCDGKHDVAVVETGPFPEIEGSREGVRVRDLRAFRRTRGS